MRNFKLLMLLCFGAALSISACKNKVEDPAPDDNHNHNAHPNSAAITIHSPTDNARFMQGDSILLSATAVGEQTLHGWELHVREKGDTTKLFTKSAHVHDKTLQISETWVNNVHHDAELELEVIVGLDHDGNKATKKASFHCEH